ncbi:MAG: glycosyltransferase family 4 protein [Bacteroidales bacterium]|nr:glycosyltransferase family 4 protein [Bacteroidales bacterium]
MHKKVLFITYYWPPAGGAPMMRIIKLYQYLPEFGYEPIILTMARGDYPFYDESLLSLVRPETIIYQTSGLSLHKIFKKLSPHSKKDFIPYGFTDEGRRGWMERFSRWVKYNMIPDTRFLWYFGTVRKAINIARQHQIDLIFSSSPPQTNHVIAARVARKLKLPWVGDFRDPWTDVFWLQYPRSIRWKWIHRLDQWLEKRTIDRMDAIITVSPSLVNLLSTKTSRPIHEIPNGFDHVYFDRLQRKPSQYFTILYAGSMSKEQYPENYFKAISSLLQENEDFRQYFRMIFMGNFPPFLHELVDQYGLSSWIKFYPYVDYEQSLQAMVDADVLLLIIPRTPDNKGILTSKLFEYLGARRPILGIGPLDGDAAKVLEKTNAGYMVDYEEIELIKEKMINFFRSWQKDQDLTISLSNIEHYTRQNIAKKFAKVFDQTIETFKPTLKQKNLYE